MMERTEMRMQQQIKKVIRKLETCWEMHAILTKYKRPD